MKTSKTEKRAEWLKSVAKEYEKSRIHEEGSPTNAKYRRGMSRGGWGYLAWAIEKAGLRSSKMNYWNGSLPTPSTAINEGYANFIKNNCPRELF